MIRRRCGAESSAGAATTRIVPGGSSALIRPMARSSALTCAARALTAGAEAAAPPAPPAEPPAPAAEPPAPAAEPPAPAAERSAPRSTTVSGHRVRSGRVSADAAGRYEITAPVGLASASAAPGPTAVAHCPGPAAEASSPQYGL